MSGSRRRSALACVIAMLSMSACATRVAPRSQMVGRLAIDGDARVMVISEEHLDRIHASLERAGIVRVATLREANVFLDVGFGGRRGGGRCGPVKNVRYTIRHSHGTAATIVGRGPIGECEDNIVDQMTSELVSLMRY